jgi:hypothetical protein
MFKHHNDGTFQRPFLCSVNQISCPKQNLFIWGIDLYSVHPNYINELSPDITQAVSRRLHIAEAQVFTQAVHALESVALRQFALRIVRFPCQLQPHQSFILILLSSVRWLLTELLNNEVSIRRHTSAAQRLNPTELENYIPARFVSYTIWARGAFQDILFPQAPTRHISIHKGLSQHSVAHPLGSGCRLLCNPTWEIAIRFTVMKN